MSQRRKRSKDCKYGSNTSGPKVKSGPRKGLYYCHKSKSRNPSYSPPLKSCYLHRKNQCVNTTHCKWIKNKGCKKTQSFNISAVPPPTIPYPEQSNTQSPQRQRSRSFNFRQQPTIPTQPQRQRSRPFNFQQQPTIPTQPQRTRTFNFQQQSSQPQRRKSSPSLLPQPSISQQPNTPIQTQQQKKSLRPQPFIYQPTKIQRRGSSPSLQLQTQQPRTQRRGSSSPLQPQQLQQPQQPRTQRRGSSSSLQPPQTQRRKRSPSQPFISKQSDQPLSALSPLSLLQIPLKPPPQPSEEPVLVSKVKIPDSEQKVPDPTQLNDAANIIINSEPVQSNPIANVVNLTEQKTPEPISEQKTPEPISEQKTPEPEGECKNRVIEYLTDIKKIQIGDGQYKDDDKYIYEVTELFEEYGDIDDFYRDSCPNGYRNDELNALVTKLKQEVDHIKQNRELREDIGLSEDEDRWSKLLIE